MFGELELNYSIGITKPPKFITDELVCYISGSTIIFINISTLETAACHFDLQLIALATNPVLSLIAYAHRGLKTVNIMQHPSLDSYEPLPHISIPNPEETLDIKEIEISKDGVYLSILTDIPNSYLYIWEISTGNHICSMMIDDFSLNSISFSPSNSSKLCGLLPNSLQFFTITSKNQTFSITTIVGNQIDEDIISYCWTIDGVLCSSAKHFYEYNPSDGKLKQSLLQNPGTAMLVLKKGLLLCFTDHISMENEIIQIPTQTVTTVVASPNYKTVLIASKSRLGVLEVSSRKFKNLYSGPLNKITGVSCFRFQKLFAACDISGNIFVWDVVSRRLVYHINVETNFTSLECCQWTSLLAVGDQKGFLRIYHVQNGLRLIMKRRVHSGAINSVSFDPMAKFLASVSDADGIVLSNVKEMAPVCHFECSHRIKDICWKYIEAEGQEEEQLVLFAMYNHDSSSKIIRLHIPINREFKNFTLKDIEYAVYIVPEILTSISVQKHTIGAEMFFTLGLDRHLKEFIIKEKTLISHEGLQLDPPVRESEEHEKSLGGTVLSYDGELLITFANDGIITCRNTSEFEIFLKVVAHDSLSEGVSLVCIDRECKTIYTVGADGIIKIWGWKYSSSGKKKAAEILLSSNSEAQDKKEFTEFLAQHILDLPTFQESENDPDEFPYTANKIVRETESERKLRIQIEESDNIFSGKLEKIKEKISSLIASNEAAPEVEKILPEEFILDFENKDRLTALAEAKIEQQREFIEKENYRKKILSQKMISEFWDSMQVMGKCVKSFSNDILTDKPLEVSNYGIRKGSKNGIERKIKLLRMVEINTNNQISQTFDPQYNKLSDEAKTFFSSLPKLLPDCSNLLYQTYEITSNENRRNQIILLQDYINDLKSNFNKKFEEISRLKLDEISKIEDKNGRIKEICEELKIQINIFSPILDSSEAPEKTLEVRDDEIKAEKYVKPKEGGNEVRKNSKEGDAQQRALMAMMNGTIEDRVDSESTEEIIPPDCISKSKNDLTEEEKKLVKEYEIKLTLQKEEREKRRKALEAELKKLQTQICDICNNFDLQLRKFFGKKLEVEQIIFIAEIQIIFLSQTLLISETYESKEESIRTRLQLLKKKKQEGLLEVNFIKKELDKSKEDYELSIKKDKELEKQFKKDFFVYDFYFEPLAKLFRQREKVNKPEEEESFDPFHNDVEEVIIKEIELSEMPEGLGVDVWQKFLEMRKRKILIEEDIRKKGSYFTELQNLINSISNNNEYLRREQEMIEKEIEEFENKKFQQDYNPKELIKLKQGQIEIIQAPVVTNYGNSILLHRECVERLNDVIEELGKAKVGALKEMKDFRKGNHLLEWETKVLDFQAEDLIIRTRDIQLLRVTKEMQEYIRSGDRQKNSNEAAIIENQLTFNQKLFQQKKHLKNKEIEKLRKEIENKALENEQLLIKVSNLDAVVQDRQKLAEASKKAQSKRDSFAIDRKMSECIKRQSKDMVELREELQRLKQKNFPML